MIQPIWAAVLVLGGLIVYLLGGIGQKGFQYNKLQRLLIEERY